MKVSFGKLHTSRDALPILADTKLPIKASYRIGRVLTSYQSEIQIFNKAHIELVQKHGGVEDEQGRMQVPKDRMDAFLPEFEELLSEECEIWGDPIHIDLLGDAEIEPGVLAVLSWLITDGSEVAAEKPKAAAASGD